MNTLSSKRLTKLVSSFNVEDVAIYLSVESDSFNTDLSISPRSALVLVAASNTKPFSYIPYTRDSEEALARLEYFPDSLARVFKVFVSNSEFAVIAFASQKSSFGSTEAAGKRLTKKIGRILREYDSESNSDLTDLNNFALSMRGELPLNMMQKLLHRVSSQLCIEGISFFVRSIAKANQIDIAGTYPRTDRRDVSYSNDDHLLTCHAWHHPSAVVANYQIDARETITGLGQVRFQDVQEPNRSATVLFVPVQVDGHVEALLRCTRCVPENDDPVFHFNRHDIQRAEILAPLLLTWFFAQRRHFRFESRLSDISHEIGQGLSGISSCVRFVDFTIRNDQRLGETYEARHKLSHALSIAEDIGFLLPALDTPTSLQGENRDHKVESFAPYGDLCRPAIERYRQDAETKNLKFDITGQDQLGAVYASVSDFHHILDNLMTNALKYTPSGETVFVKLERSTDNEDFHRIHVMSRSIHIDPSEHSKIFWSGYRAENASLVDSGGRGRGLAIARSFAQKYGGDIILNVADEYNIFTLLLAKRIFRPS